MPLKYCLLSSTGGAVAQRVWNQDDRFREALKLVVCDRSCGAATFARENGIRLVLIPERRGLEFSNKLAQTLKEQEVDYVVCFFTRLLRGPICETFGDRIFNFHPSLLPACPGMRGFEDSVASGAMFVGSTVHLINDQMDAGRIVIQSAISSRSTGGDIKALRHRIFNQQCAQLLQIFLWSSSGRLNTGENAVTIAGVDYSGNDLSIPGIEDAVARTMMGLV